MLFFCESEQRFPDNWLQTHTDACKVGRVQNFKNWFIGMVADSSKTSLGVEYFASVRDDVWGKTNEDLIELAVHEATFLSVTENVYVEDFNVIRKRNVYDEYYMENINIIKEYLELFQHLQTVGKNGLHRYNSQDHSNLAGPATASNLQGDNVDVWSINVDRAYCEEFKKSKLLAIT